MKLFYAHSHRIYGSRLSYLFLNFQKEHPILKSSINSFRTKVFFSFQYYDNIVSSFTIKSRFIHIFKNLIVTFYTIILFSQLFLRLNKLYGKNV